MNKENLPSAKKQTHFKQFPQKINSLPQFKKSAPTKNISPPQFKKSPLYSPYNTTLI